MDSKKFTPLRQRSLAPGLLAGLTLLAAQAAAAPIAHAAPAAPTDAALAAMLAAKPSSGWASVIVQSPQTLSPGQEAQIAALGGDITRRLTLIHALAVRVPKRNLAALAGLPFVSRLSLDGLIQKTDEFTVKSSKADQAKATSALGLPYQLTGKGVSVAVIDSGVAHVADLGGKTSIPLLSLGGDRVAVSVDMTQSAPQGKGPKGGPKAAAQDDPCGHGTHVAGIIAGNGSKSSDPNAYRHFLGIAPQASIVSVRVLDASGQTDVGTVIAGITWVINHKNDDPNNVIRVINLSLGHPVGESYTTDPLCQAVEAAYQAGIVVVCAAGNDGRASDDTNTAGQDNEGWGTNYGSINSPANDPYVITVGATKSADGSRANDKIATYSGRGPSRLDFVMKPDIVAPGNKIISLDANNSTLDNYAGGTNDIPQAAYRYVKKGDAVSNDYFQLSGTSMAAPVVAGAVALLLQASPALTPDTVKARLMLSADKWAAPDGTGDALTYGAGGLLEHPRRAGFHRCRAGSGDQPEPRGQRRRYPVGVNGPGRLGQQPVRRS